jgi:outer membrane protein TolC
MNKVFAFTTFILISSFVIKAQGDSPVLSLSNVIELAQVNSPSYQKAVTSAENSYWSFKSYRSTLFPRLGLDATIPSYQAGNDRILQPDGTFELRKRSVLYNSAYLQLDQNVPFTGGVFSVASSLNRNESFAPSQNLEYFSVPLTFNYNQPMLLYNQFRWDKRIQPLMYDESMKRYTEDIEKISIETSSFFFDAITAQISHDLAEMVKQNTDTLYKLSVGRYNLGKIAEDELLSIELRLLNAENALFQANINKENSYKNLMRFLGYPLDTVIRLALPDNTPDLIILEEKALLEAYENRQQVLEFERRKLQADQQIARARGNSGYDLNVRGQFGVSGVGDNIQDSYIGANSQQQYVAVNFRIPIVDWGAAKSRVRVAKSNKDLELVNIDQEEINFAQEVSIEVKNYTSQRKQLVIASRADTIAQIRYNVTKQRYLIGKIKITDLNIAQQEMSNSRLTYLRALRDAWISYYRIRALTLYNFEDNQKIFFEYNPI